VRAALRLGAFQLFDGVAAHAAVGETVAVAPERARRFVNGVLRALARRSVHWPVVTDATPVEALGAMSSHPDWVARMLVEQFGAADAMATLAIDNEPPRVTLRTNGLRTTSDDLIAQLRADGVEASHGVLVADAVVLEHPGDPGALVPVRDGLATPQDQASQAVVALLDPRPGARVVDLAAAPGGKTGALAERVGDDGLVIASDVHPGRLGLVRAAAARLGLRAVRTVLADGRAAPFVRGAFDCVLLDAPCSGLGVLRRRPEARWRVSPGDVRDLAARQRELLASAATLVRPGGRLCYSVCTVTPEETVDVDSWARDALDAFVAVEPPGRPWRSHGRGAVLLPHDAGTDGMYVLLLQRPA
jgi:16S rRNA (cytosine967-C5)-methyltransferase